MRNGFTTLLAALTGAVVGAVITLSLPVPGAPEPETSEPSPPSAAGAILGEARISTLLAWTPSRLPEGFPAAVRKLDTVDAVAVVRSGVAWLTSWRDREGTIRRPPAGLMVPLEVAAIEPEEYLDFIPPAEWSPFGQLERGGALLGQGGAELREIGAGGSLTFGDLPLLVRDVVDDALIGAHEAVVSRSVGSRLGIVRPRYMLIAPSSDASRHEIESALLDLLPSGVRLRVRGPGETPVFRHGDAVLPQVTLKEIFGEFAAAPGPGGTLRQDETWREENLKTGNVPILGRITCHRRVFPQLRAALGELVARGISDLVDPGDYGGCYSPRFLLHDPSLGISHHAWGVAIDLNSSQNPFGAEPTMDARVVEVFERWGLAWGGRWLIPDGTHFEFLRFPLSPKG